MTPPIVRPAIAADRDALLALHDRCSVESRHHRWFAPLPAMPSAYLESALAGRDEHLALVAVDGDVVGLGSAVLGDEGWELAVLVQDDHQRRSIGTALLDRLVDELRDRGVTRVRADVLVGRRGLLDRLAKYGPLDVRLVDVTLRAVVRLSPV
ncbi:MAG: GNAT family N-acetyltransferase [Jatrophihabitans sp.]|uniref:GNAT family N-acetyltransferase n=1 Tax=Jatrophihabitans sp. TaxID=1932789 RepID=UPI003F7D3029